MKRKIYNNYLLLNCMKYIQLNMGSVLAIDINGQTVLQKYEEDDDMYHI